jgi:hypothetical protein
MIYKQNPQAIHARPWVSCPWCLGVRVWMIEFLQCMGSWGCKSWGVEGGGQGIRVLWVWGAMMHELAFYLGVTSRWCAYTYQANTES